MNFGLFRSHIKKSDIPCNCPWMECDAHHGKLCGNMAAMALGCPNPDCKTVHYLGDETFGDDIHICVECAEALGKIFIEDVPDFMNRFTSFVPPELKSLEKMLKECYGMYLAQEEGWIRPQDDARAVLCFAYTVIRLDSNKKIPVPLVGELVALVTKVINMQRAFDNTSIKEMKVPL